MLILAMVLTLGTSVFAFDDMSDADGKDKDKILSLKEKGIVQGNGKLFGGNKKLTNAEGVHLIVKGMDLSLAAFLFIKEPLASDYFDNVPDRAWYSEDFVIASVNGVGLPADINPKANMTREEFAHYLFTAMMLKGDFPFTKMLYSITDEEEINPDFRHSIQLLLNGKITELDDKGKFYPKRDITRREAAVMLYNTIEFVKSHTEPIPDDGVNVEEKVTFTTEKINDGVNKVTLSWGEQPNPGYGISISEIVFVNDKTAEIYYRLHYPEKDKMYPQVITTPTAVTYLSSQYDVVLKRAE